jgi:hypothetical protein
LNLFEAGALLGHEDGVEASAAALDVARSHGIAVLTNRPLNAFVGGTMIRLAVVPVEGVVIDVDSQLARVTELEETYRNHIAHDVPMAPDAIEPDRLYRWAEQLREIDPKALSLEQWSGRWPCFSIVNSQGPFGIAGRRGMNSIFPSFSNSLGPCGEEWRKRRWHRVPS